MWDSYLDSMGVACAAIRDFLTPKDRFGPPDPLISMVQRVVSVLGVVIVVSVSIAFKGVDVGALGGVFDHKLTSMVPNAGLALIAVLLGMSVLLIAAAPAERRRMLRSFSRPASALGAVGCAGLALQLYIMLTQGAMAWVNDPKHWYLFFVGIAAALVLVALLLLVVLPLAVWIAWLCVNNFCNAADGHPMLPWLATVAFAAETWALSLHSALTTGFGPPVPPVIGACTTLGGPPVVVVLSVVAMLRLRGARVSLRSVPTEPVSFPESGKPGIVHRQWTRVRALFP
jgi:hypothetical protein